MRAFKNSSQTKSQKMLASTVQFSTYNQTPATRPRQTHRLPRERQRYEMQTGPEPKQQIHPETRMSPLPQDPTARLRTRPHARTPIHAHPRRDAQYWEPATRAGRTGQRSTLELHPAHTPAARD